MELDPENHEVDTPIVKYVNGYKVVTCECGENELSKDAYLTVLHTNKDVTDDLIVPEVNEDGVYSFDFTTPAWGRISLFYAGEKISTETATFVRATGWIDGAYRGSYELYWDADSKDNTVFLSAVGGTYHVSFDPEANEVIVGDDYRIGFSYDGTFYGHPAIEDGVYTIIETFAQWNRVQLFYNNVVLDAETATFTGAISTVGNVNEPKLYFEEGKLFYGASLGKVTFSITYNPETNVVDIQEVPLEDNQARIAKVNADCGADAVAIYTEAGAKLKTVTDATTGATTYVGNGWRLYIVVDAEGRIAYLVQMPPNGYGGPSGTSYYCHSSYTDYTTNPAFNILDGFGPWVSGGFAHNLYEVVVPEGGFGIVAHGAGITELLDALGVGAGRADGTVNARNLLASDVRLSYDAKMGVLTVNPEAAAE